MPQGCMCWLYLWQVPVKQMITAALAKKIRQNILKVGLFPTKLAGYAVVFVRLCIRWSACCGVESKSQTSIACTENPCHSVTKTVTLQ